MHLLSDVDHREWECAVKLLEYGLRFTSAYQILDGRVPKDVLAEAAKAINPECCKQGKTISRAPISTQQERLLATLVTKVYLNLRDGLSSISMAEAVVYLYEEAWEIAKSPVFRRPFTADEIYAIVRNVSNGQLQLSVCKGTADTPHPGPGFSFVIDREEPAMGLCPWCASTKRQRRAKTTAVATKSDNSDTSASIPKRAAG